MGFRVRWGMTVQIPSLKSKSNRKTSLLSLISERYFLRDEYLSVPSAILRAYRNNFPIGDRYFFSGALHAEC
jgi:hypothetical protein